MSERGKMEGCLKVVGYGINVVLPIRQAGVFFRVVVL